MEGGEQLVVARPRHPRWREVKPLAPQRWSIEQGSRQLVDAEFARREDHLPNSPIDVVPINVDIGEVVIGVLARISDLPMVLYPLDHTSRPDCHGFPREEPSRAGRFGGVCEQRSQGSCMMWSGITLCAASRKMSNGTSDD